MSYEDLSKHGVEIRKNEFGEGDRVRYVRLDWPAEWWADVLNKHGEFLPMCCANLSAIRDNLTTALREGGWIECEDLAECLAYMGGHGWDDYLQDNGCPMPDPIEDPMLDLIWKWRLVEDVAHLTIRPRPLDPTNLKDAVRAVHGFAWKLWQDALFANGPDACPNLQNKAERLRASPWFFVIDPMSRSRPSGGRRSTGTCRTPPRPSTTGPTRSLTTCSHGR